MKKPALAGFFFCHFIVYVEATAKENPPHGRVFITLGKLMQTGLAQGSSIAFPSLEKITIAFGMSYFAYQKEGGHFCSAISLHVGNTSIDEGHPHGGEIIDFLGTQIDHRGWLAENRSYLFFGLSKRDSA